MTLEVPTFEKVTLTGKFVRLEPLIKEHCAGLCEAIVDGELWKLFVTKVPHPDKINAFFDQAVAWYEAGDGLTFATLDKTSNKVIGSTRFMKADLANNRVEIGFTFLAKHFQKTCANTEAKLLMLSYGFETLRLNRIEFLTDYLNQTSRNAILRLGAKQEGILRSHMIMPDGRIRDSVIFSITAQDWPGVKQHLQYKLSQMQD